MSYLPMPLITVEIEEALALRDRGALLIDARSPGEYVEATIPGAINVPLLDDGQRSRVGTVYKEQGPQQARWLGVELVSPGIPAMLSRVREALEGERRPVVVFCWRGGMRSRALTTFLDLAGIPARQLIGGYKAFRSHVCDFLESGRFGRLLVLRGLTGVGKTRLLLKLEQEGYPVIDLEGLANHRGSAFGALGLPEQPSQKCFEALLWDKLRRIPEGGYALAEGESRNIGKLVLPKRVYAALQTETSIWVQASLEHRVKVVLEDYPASEELKQAFVGPIRALKRRLGAQRVEELLQLLEQESWDELVRRLMVDYYDPLYRHTLPERRIEVDIEPEERGMERLRRAIARLREGDDVGSEE